jgi:hypothetical protein
MLSRLPNRQGPRSTERVLTTFVLGLVTIIRARPSRRASLTIFRSGSARRPLRPSQERRHIGVKRQGRPHALPDIIDDLTMHC